jgi:hypothetical protein
MYQADLEGELIRFFGEEIGFSIFFTVLKKKKKKRCSTTTGRELVSNPASRLLACWLKREALEGNHL